MAEGAPEHRIFELEGEQRGWAHATQRRERAAEHQGPVRRRGAARVSRIPLEQIARIQHRGYAALLIESSLLTDVRAQDETVPMPRDLRMAPPRNRDGLVAHLLGHRDV